MNHHGKINYVEFPSRDLALTKQFFTAAFGWTFVDYGPQYTAFEGEGLDGGFYLADKSASAEAGSALVIFYSERLEETQSQVEQAGGVISTQIFSFPCGRRFHFIEPSGNELAVWSDQ